MSYGTLMEEKTTEIYDLFKPVEGFNNVYYGKIRNGKTYAATTDIIELLNQGEVVYANWQIDWDGFDQRDSLWAVTLKLLTGNPHFYKFDRTNFHYLDISSPTFINDINKLVGVHLFIDEGQWIFNSHLKTDDPDKRRLVLEGGHYCRSLNVITQRPSNILKDIRSQVHVWYKCEKVLHLGKFIRFVRWTIEDMKDDLPVDPDDMEKKPPSKAYWASNKVKKAYNTHGRRRDDAVLVVPDFDVYELTTSEKINQIKYLIIPEFISRRLARVRQRRQKPDIKPIAQNTKENKGRWKLGDLKVPK